MSLKSYDHRTEGTWDPLGPLDNLYDDGTKAGTREGPFLKTHDGEARSPEVI